MLGAQKIGEGGLWQFLDGGDTLLKKVKKFPGHKRSFTVNKNHIGSVVSDNKENYFNMYYNNSNIFLHVFAISQF